MNKMKKQLLKTVKVLKKNFAHAPERPIFELVSSKSAKWN
jgi:hypothetical protein